MREGEDGQTKWYDSNFGGDFFPFSNTLQDFPWKKAQICHISSLKKVQGARFLVLVPEGRQEYRGILMYFYFHIWFITKFG
jgi:hypothetical protein